MSTAASSGAEAQEDLPTKDQNREPASAPERRGRSERFSAPEGAGVLRRFQSAQLNANWIFGSL